MKWFEEYKGCGCASEIAPRKKDLLGYCAIHGGSRRHAFPVPLGMEEFARTEVGELEPDPCRHCGEDLVDRVTV